MDKKRMLLISTVILAATLIFVGYQIKVPYKEQIPNQQGLTNTISVAGEGKSYAIPDTLVINLSVSELASTAKDAQKKTNDKLSKIKDILRSGNIAKENIQTTNVNIYPEYDYTSTQRKLLGYRSQQSLNIEVIGDNFAQRGADLIDTIIAEVGNINIDNVGFTLKNKDKAMEEARTKAYEDAKNKADQLAKLGSVSLGKPTMISDQEIQYTPAPYYSMAMKTAEAGVADMNTVPLSPGQMEITIRINVTYEIK